MTERQLQVLHKLRNNRYTGYIHLRVMPGVSRQYIREATELADRVGVNLEAPDEGIFSEICPDKGNFKGAILKRLEWVVNEAQRARAEKPRPEFGFAKAGVDTQLIVGAVNPDIFPFDLNTATYHEILRIPQIGPVTARKIITARRGLRIRYSLTLSESSVRI